MSQAASLKSIKVIGMSYYKMASRDLQDKT